MLKKIVLKTLCISVFFCQGAIADDYESRHWSADREEKDAGKLDSFTQNYLQSVYDRAINSVPLYEHNTAASKTVTRSSFTIGEKGQLIKLNSMSPTESVSTDFWTLYAIASCPPIKPPQQFLTDASMDITFVTLRRKTMMMRRSPIGG